VFPAPGAVRPWARLVQGADGNFYGTTVQGGIADLGTIFKVTSTGTFTILHEFTGNGFVSDGAYPYSPLILARRTATTTGRPSKAAAKGPGACTR
jgi:uncharacterized repeat protein (TIGR03803 family)